ncbi:MAG TPA: hypothetical protein EYN67_17835 [Flavobacteriales bacterium]|nr:hypothetical protein [Flavobacteriales bacterium]
MSWGMAAVAGASLVGGIMSSNAAGDAAAQQQAGTQAGIESQERMFDKSLELQAPYREAGYGALEGLQSLVDPQGRADMLQSYYAGPEYSALSGQVEEQQMRNAAATGGVRGGANQAALASIAPQLGQQYLGGLNQQYTGLANMGMGAASQGSGQAMQLGGNISNLQQQAAQAGASNSMAQANIWGNVASDFAGLGYNYLNK